jgi:hypothetical protein
MPSPESNAFRYEPTLCTLPEGATLAQWRSGAGTADESDERRPGLVERLRAIRPGGRRMSAG